MGFFLISYFGIYVPGCWLSGKGRRKEARGPITHTQIVTETVNFILIVTPTIQCFSFFPGWRASLSQFLQGTIAWLCVLGESENLTIPYIGFQPVPLISAVSLPHFQRHLVLLSPEAFPSFVRKAGSIFTVPSAHTGLQLAPLWEVGYLLHLFLIWNVLCYLVCCFSFCSPFLGRFILSLVLPVS